MKKQILSIGSAVVMLGTALGIAFGIGARSGESLPTPTPTGLVVKESPYSVEETESRLDSVLKEKGINTFAAIDHAQNAESTGLALRPTRVIIFGNPKLGTPLMQCSQSIAIDLPQKMLIWEDEAGQVQIAYNDPRYLGGRHRLDGCGSEVIQTIAGALNNFSNQAIAP